MDNFLSQNTEALIFDSHAHYDDKSFDKDRNDLLLDMHKSGVCGILNCATNFDDMQSTLSLAEKYDFIYAALGLHPECVGNKLPQNNSWLYDLAELLSVKNVVALGEIGLDYYWEENAPRDIQKFYFEKQLELSKELDIPVVIHDREAHADTFELIKKYHPRGVLHCFSGSLEMARQLVNLGMYIGLGGVVTFKNARNSLEVAKNIDENYLLLETDAPYMAPEPFRGKRNVSSYITKVAEKIAGLRDTSTEHVLSKTRDNALQIFLGQSYE